MQSQTEKSSFITPKIQINNYQLVEGYISLSYKQTKGRTSLMTTLIIMNEVRLHEVTRWRGYLLCSEFITFCLLKFQVASKQEQKKKETTHWMLNKLYH